MYTSFKWPIFFTIVITILVLRGPKISKYKDLREDPYSLAMYVPGVLIFQNFRIQENNLVGGEQFFFITAHIPNLVYQLLFISL